MDGPIELASLYADRGRVLAETPSAALLDLDDGVLCLEFRSKGNTLNGDTLTVAEHAWELIPGRHRGLVVGNQGAHFSYGADLRWLLRLLESVHNDRKRFRTEAKRFQRFTTGMRTAPFPTVAAPFGFTVGGALELAMYSDRVVAHTALRAMLPEISVGILPDLGGTSELYARSVEHFGDRNLPQAVRHAFETIVFSKQSTNAAAARDLLFLREEDRVVTDLDSLIADAKAHVIALSANYVPPAHRQEIPVLGKLGFVAIEGAIAAMVVSGKATEYDAEIARAVARVMTGGGEGLPRSIAHEEMLDLETQWFETLVFNQKTRDRMEHFLATGQPLRN